MFKRLQQIGIPADLHINTQQLVLEFAEALAEKLYKAQEKYGYTDGWKDPNWMEQCRTELRNHIEKGDPLDVSAYCAFLWFHKEPTKIK